MELNAHFSNCCRKLNGSLKASQLSFKKILSGKRVQKQTGIVCKYSFDDFNMLVYYIEKGKAAYAQQTIWIAFTVDNEPNLVFSLYDILALTQPVNFNCYTYTYVDSAELMTDCFSEISDLLSELLPQLKAVFESGVSKNKLVEIQKNNLNNYFGDKILEANDMMGGIADKLISMMLSNFFEYQIECAVVGAQALFYSGKTEKALKTLKKLKFRSQYESNLMKYIENGGKAPIKTEVLKKASAESGSKRHNGGISDILKNVALTIGITIPFSAMASLLFYLIISIKFNDAVFIGGVFEIIVCLVAISVLPSGVIALRLSQKLTEIKNKKSNVKTPVESSYRSTFTKYVTIFIETLFIVQFITCINSVTVFNNDSMRYAQDDFPLSQQVCSYDSIKLVAIINESAEDKPFPVDERYLVLYTNSGTVIDLYNSTYLSADEVISEIKPLLKSKNISIEEYSSVDSLISENR